MLQASALLKRKCNKENNTRDDTLSHCFYYKAQDQRKEKQTKYMRRGVNVDEIRELIIRMIEYYEGDPKRIHHFIKVHSFAKIIAMGEGLELNTMYCLEVAAVVHDIGIKPAEEKYGKGICGGALQQELGVGPARKMLSELGLDKDLIERVCFLIAHHHTYTDVEGIDWQILLEADFLVNAFEDNISKDSIRNFREKVFRTDTGIALLNKTFGV